jgi:hypothetical protein
MSYNANRYMTLAAGDRALRSNDPRRQCAGAKPRRGRKLERGFAEAEPPEGGVQLQSCYVQRARTPLFKTNILY